jgi:hypothetical protein
MVGLLGWGIRPLEGVQLSKYSTPEPSMHVKNEITKSSELLLGCNVL